MVEKIGKAYKIAHQDGGSHAVNVHEKEMIKFREIIASQETEIRKLREENTNLLGVIKLMANDQSLSQEKFFTTKAKVVNKPRSRCQQLVKQAIEFRVEKGRIENL